MARASTIPSSTLEALAPRAPIEVAAPALAEVLEATAADSAAAPRRPRALLGSFDQPDRERVLRHIAVEIALIDQLISDQVNAIIHHARFQRLEASWRGLRYLVEQIDADGEVLVRMLDVSWRELTLDADLATEFDQSQLFRMVYEREFGTAGGRPFGLLVGDYTITHRPRPGHRDDINTLRSISETAAAAFAPFIAGADEALLGLERFEQLDRVDVSRVFDHPECIAWNALRAADDARFVGLALPRTLMRPPWPDDGSRNDGFRFREDVEGPDAAKFLWGNAAYAFAGVVIRAFRDSGWLADIRGVRRGEDGGGVVADLAHHAHETDLGEAALRPCTDVVITDELEKGLSDLGLIPLCHCKDTEYAAFYSNTSIQKPKTYTEPAATMNSRISAMLQYVLCASRIAHYLKVTAREKIGSFSEASELETYLNVWVTKYVTPDAEAPPDVKAKYPLREARVQVRPHPSAPGHYLSTMHLLPHYQLDTLVATVRLDDSRLRAAVGT